MPLILKVHLTLTLIVHLVIHLTLIDLTLTLIVHLHTFIY